MTDETDERITVPRHIAADHPAFAGHFPGRPLLPGALLLADVLEALHGVPALAACLGPTPRVNAAKFLAPVAPGSDLVIAFRCAHGGVDFDVHCGATQVAKGRFDAGAAP